MTKALWAKIQTLGESSRLRYGDFSHGGFSSKGPIFNWLFLSLISYGSLIYLALTSTNLYAASADSWLLDIDTCASGLSAQMSNRDVSYALYLWDQNCLGKLKAFSAFGKSFYPKKGFDFSTWTTGSTAVFTDQNRDFDVQVTSQLPEVLGKPATITYQIFDKDLDSKKHTIGNFLFGTPTVVQQKSGPLEFTFAPLMITIKDQNIKSQSLGLQIQLECTSKMTREGTCIKTQIDSLSYALIENKNRQPPCKPKDPLTCWNLIKKQNNPPIVFRESMEPYNGGFDSAIIDTLHNAFANPRYLFLVGSSRAVWILPVSFLNRGVY